MRGYPNLELTFSDATTKKGAFHDVVSRVPLVTAMTAIVHSCDPAEVLRSGWGAFVVCAAQ